MLTTPVLSNANLKHVIISGRLLSLTKLQWEAKPPLFVINAGFCVAFTDTASSKQVASLCARTCVANERDTNTLLLAGMRRHI